jgi:hypothetical protein
MVHYTPIIAAGWAEIIGPLVVFIFYILGHLLSGKGNKPQPQPRIPKPRGAAVPPQQPRTLEEKLRGEVEEFLRQVQGEAPRPAKPQPVVVMQRPVVVSEIEPRRESLQEHVAKHISTADVTQHTATLGAEVGLADEKMVAHLQERFQHHVGALEPRQQRAAPQRRQNTAAVEFAQLLRSPNGMRQIIIANEILRRPEI